MIIRITTTITIIKIIIYSYLYIYIYTHTLDIVSTPTLFCDKWGLWMAMTSWNTVGTSSRADLCCVPRGSLRMLVRWPQFSSRQHLGWLGRWLGAWQKTRQVENIVIWWKKIYENIWNYVIVNYAYRVIS